MEMPRKLMVVAIFFVVLGFGAFSVSVMAADSDGKQSDKSSSEKEQPSKNKDAKAASEQKKLEKPAQSVDSLKTSKDVYGLKIRDLEQRVNELKEKIFRSKARLMLLRETVLTGVISGAKARIVHSNEMGGSFKLISASYYLDGAPIYKKVDTEGKLDKEKSLQVFAGNVVPGPHLISVQLQYVGYGYGIFSYLNGYKFKIKSSYSFNAEEGKITNIKVVGYEKGGLAVDIKDRPSVRYDVQIKRESTVDTSLQKKASTADSTNAESSGNEQGEGNSSE
ncbi:MAG: dihydrolipoamide acetyltransferase [Deltaproteobacteria bacterium]|nr:dihydrolipoamide acetyltransferase [Deltaproteobacteria bacterium]